MPQPTNKILALSMAGSFGMALFFALPAFAVPASVRIVDEADAPINGAKVWFRAAANQEIKTATTDANGIAQADIPADDDTSDLGWVIIYAHGKALARGPISATAPEGPNKGPKTFKLGPGGSISGLVQDKAGKPVANASVHLQYVMKQVRKAGGFPELIFFEESKGWETFSATTDATGHWTFDGLPPGWNANYGLLAPRFAKVNENVLISATGTTSAKPLIARPGAIVAGRVIDEKGKPLAAVEVYASDGNTGWDRTTTGADGNYRISRLSTGVFKVHAVSEDNAPRVASPLPSVRVKEGAVTQAADLVMTPGALVEGQVTDALTGAPIKGVTISVPSNSTKTDANGHYSVRALSGAGKIYVMGKPQDYLYPKVGSPSNNSNVTLAEGVTKTISFKLPPATPLKGTAQDEAGHPAEGAVIIAGQQWEETPATVGKDGKFSIKGMEPGPVELSTRGDWLLAQPRTVTLPLKEALVVKLKRSVNVPLSGRVIDEKGAPVANAEVALSEYIPITPTSASSSTVQVLTDADGRWTWTPQHSDTKVGAKGKKEGYRFVSGGEIQERKQIMAINGTMVTDDKASRPVTDIVLQKLTASLSGRVLDAGGAPVAGAYVWAPTSEGTTGPDGTWQLTELPPGPVEIFAATDKLFGSAKVDNSVVPQDAAPAIDISLGPLSSSPPEGAAARAFFDLVMAESKGEYAFNLLPALALSDPAAALKLTSDLKPETRDAYAAMILKTFAATNPTRAHEEIPNLLQENPAILTGEAAVRTAIEIAPYMPDEALAVYDRERPKLAPLKTTDFQAISPWLAMGALAARLDKPADATALVEPAIEALVQLVAAGPADQGYRYYLDSTFEVIASGGTKLVEQAIAKLPDEIRPLALAEAIAPLAEVDLEGAQNLLTPLKEKLQAETGDPLLNPHYYYHRGLFAIMGRLGPTNPEAALALARSVTINEYQSKALALAATWQPAAERAKLLQQAYDLPAEYAQPIWRLPIVRRALALDMTLGESLLTDMEQQTLKGNNVIDDMNRRSIIDLPWLMAPVHPGRARLLLEGEWERRKSQERGDSSDIAVAMMRVDWKRALEMAENLRKTDANGIMQDSQRRYTLQLMAQWVIAPADWRANVSFDAMRRMGIASIPSPMD
jgi:protocatechuate 3,4-dioxygenase beta subunit